MPRVGCGFGVATAAVPTTAAATQPCNNGLRNKDCERRKCSYVYSLIITVRKSVLSIRRTGSLRKSRQYLPECALCGVKDTNFNILRPNSRPAHPVIPVSATMVMSRVTAASTAFDIATITTREIANKTSPACPSARTCFAQTSSCRRSLAIAVRPHYRYLVQWRGKLR